MAKEHKQFLVVVVLLLAAVVLIDAGNSRLSGKLVDRRNVLADDTLDLQQATEIASDGETEDAITPQQVTANKRKHIKYPIYKPPTATP